MAFLFPSFLWALTALAVPIIIHLFQLRRFKRIDFPNVRFLQEVSQQTRSRKKIRHWLVLLARSLALASLVLAFAQPYLPNAGNRVKAGQRAVSLFVDDSWSMDGTNAQGRLLDQARTDAQDAVMSFNATDRYQVITNEFEGRQQMMLGRDEALEAVGQVEVGPFSRSLSHVLTRQREALSRSDAPVKRSFLFTDLQRSVCDVDQWTNDSTITTAIVPLTPDNADNLAVDSVWFATPVRRLGQSEALHIRIRNSGTQALENVPLKLTIDGRQRALATFAADAQSTVDTVLHFTNDATGQHWCEVSLTDRPVTFDDDLFIAYRTVEKLRVLLVGGGDVASDKNIAAVFTSDSAHAFSSQPYRQIDLGSLGRTDLLVLNALPDVPSGTTSALKDFVTGGGSLAIFPGNDPDPASWSALLAQFGGGFGARDTTTMKVERIDLQQPFFGEVFTSMPKNVELPLVRTRFAITLPPTADELLRLQGGGNFLGSIPVGKGRVYICASPLSDDAGTFTRHALFVTSLLRMAELSRPMGALYHVIGEETNITLDGVDINGEAAPHLKGPSGIDLVPEVRHALGTTSIALHDEDLSPGAYALTMNNDTIAAIALDLPRAESDLRVFTPDELEKLLTQRGLTSFKVLDKAGNDLAQSMKELDAGTKLWKWFIAGALLFLMLEILFIRASK